MAVPFSIKLRLRSLQAATTLAGATVAAAFALVPLGTQLRAASLRIPFDAGVGGVAPTPTPTPAPTPTPTPTPTPGPTPTPTPSVSKLGNVADNLVVNTYYNKNDPFLDRMKTGLMFAGFVSNGSGGDKEALAPYNSNLFPTGLPANATQSYVASACALPTNITSWSILHDGTADLSIVLTLGGNNLVKVSATEYTFTSTGDRVAWRWTSAPSTWPTSKWSIVPTAQKADHLAGKMLNPVFVAEKRKRSILRFMGWGNTNGSLMSTWSQRCLPSMLAWSQDRTNGLTGYNGFYDVPLEVMIALCNESGTDMWYCMPAHANDTFVTNALTLIRDTLNPGLNLHLECSNETWNFIFEQAHYFDDIAKAEGMPNGYRQAFGRRMAQIFRVGKDLFPAGRVVTRMGVQHINTNTYTDTVAGIVLANVGTEDELVDRVDGTFYTGEALGGYGDVNATNSQKTQIMAWSNAILTGNASQKEAALAAMFDEVRNGSNSNFIDHGVTYLVWKQFRDTWETLANNRSWRFGMYEGQFTHTVYTYSFSPADIDNILVPALKVFHADPRAATALQEEFDYHRSLANAAESALFEDMGQNGRPGPWGSKDGLYSPETTRSQFYLTYQETPHVAVPAASLKVIGGSMTVPQGYAVTRIIAVKGGQLPIGPLTCPNLPTGVTLVDDKLSISDTAPAASVTLNLSASTGTGTVNFTLGLTIQAAIQYKYFRMIITNSIGSFGPGAATEAASLAEWILENPDGTRKTGTYTATSSEFGPTAPQRLADNSRDGQDSTYVTNYDAGDKFPYGVQMNADQAGPIGHSRLWKRAGDNNGPVSAGKIYGYVNNPGAVAANAGSGGTLLVDFSGTNANYSEGTNEAWTIL